MCTTYKGMLDSVHCTKSTFCKRLIHIFSKYFVQCDIFKHLHMHRILCKVIFQWTIYSLNKQFQNSWKQLPKYTWANRILPHYISRLQYVPYRWKFSTALKFMLLKWWCLTIFKRLNFQGLHILYCVHTCVSYVMCINRHVNLFVHLALATMYLRISVLLLREKHYSEISHCHNSFTMAILKDGLHLATCFKDY